MALGCAPEATDLGLPSGVDEALSAPEKVEFCFLNLVPLEESKPLPRIGPYQVVRTVSPPADKKGEIEAWMRFEALKKGAPAPPSFHPAYGVRVKKAGASYGFAIDLKLSAFTVYDENGKEIGGGTIDSEVTPPEKAMPWLSPISQSNP